MSHISRLRGNLFGNYPPRAAINAAREEEEGEGGAAEREGEGEEGLQRGRKTRRGGGETAERSSLWD